MGLFSSKPTLEERVTTAEAALATANSQIETITAERDAALASAALAETERDGARAECESATQNAATLQALLDADTATGETMRAAYCTALEFTEPEIAALTTENFAEQTRAAVTRLAHREAVQIAAAQGVPPVITAPSAAADEDELKQAYEIAAGEPDPRKRARLFSIATAKVNARKVHGNN